MGVERNVSSVVKKLSVVLVLTVFTADILAMSVGEAEPVIELPVVKDFTCFDIFNKAYLNDIPNPTNCSLFLKCVQDPYGIPNPVMMVCPPTLHFDFNTCNCNWPTAAVCYERDNLTHVENTFKCACPLIKGENGTLIPEDGDDDRCSNGETGGVRAIRLPQLVAK